MERCAGLKKAMEGKGGKVSYNAMVIKAVGTALREHPAFNAHYLPEGIRTLGDANVGMAVGLNDGLVVPVVRNADRKTLAEVSQESSSLMRKALAGKLSLAEMSGGSFTVSNLGMHGIDFFTAIINPPQVGILAVGKVREAPVVEGGKVVPGLVMTVTLSADHRAVDGLRGAEFLESIRKALEEGLEEGK
jgi:pyruvate dehydrogenase E2 component (dihydrolipoamide acetyltransferase)